MEREPQSVELCCPQRRQDFCGKRAEISGVAGPVESYLQFGDVGDILDRRGVALASEEARQILTVTERNWNVWRLAADEATCNIGKGVESYQAADRGETRG